MNNYDFSHRAVVSKGNIDIGVQRVQHFSIFENRCLLKCKNSYIFVDVCYELIPILWCTFVSYFYKDKGFTFDRELYNFGGSCCLCPKKFLLTIIA